VPNVHNAATAVFLPLNFTNMLRREMPNGDPPPTYSDVLHYALDEGLNMIFEEGLESARRRKGPKAMGLQPFPQTPHAPAPPQLPSRPRQASSPPTPGRPLGRNTASCGGRLEDSALRLGLMAVRRPTPTSSWPPRRGA
jgi:aspartate aminotransferase-like enzyme